MLPVRLQTLTVWAVLASLCFPKLREGVPLGFGGGISDRFLGRSLMGPSGSRNVQLPPTRAVGLRGGKRLSSTGIKLGFPLGLTCAVYLWMR